MMTIFSIWCGICFLVAICVGAVIAKELVQALTAKYQHTEAKEYALGILGLAVVTTFAVLAITQFLTLFN